MVRAQFGSTVLKKAHLLSPSSTRDLASLIFRRVGTKQPWLHSNGFPRVQSARCITPNPAAHRRISVNSVAHVGGIRSIPPSLLHLPSLRPSQRLWLVDRRMMSLGPGDDPYKVLGVQPGLADKEYKVAYLKLAKQYHPDLNPGDEAATRKFQQLSAAYNAIKDETSRQAWRQQQSYSQQRSSGDPRGAWSGFSSPTRNASSEEVWEAAAKDAAAMAEAFGDFLQEQAKEVERDITAFSDAAYRRDWPVARELAMKRKGLIIGVAVPLLVVLRWPAAAVAALRVASLGAGSVLKLLAGVIAVMVRSNPQLLVALWGMIAPLATAVWEGGVRRARDRLRQRQNTGGRR